MTPEERITALEVRVLHLTDTIDNINETVTELRDLLVAARGARWMLAILIALGSFSAGALVQFIPFLGNR
jgi:uncharacterized coiled-coil protein SlyX